MKLNTVTITGADNSIDPSSLIDLSREFPFVEWGILLSRSQERGKRFPSRQWMKKLAEMANDHGLDNPIHTAGHLCGAWLRDLLNGDLTCPHFDLGIFERVQLNFHGGRQEVERFSFLTALQKIEQTGRKIIFQFDGVNGYLLKYAMNGGIDAQALFDMSHGTGVSPVLWPTPIDGCYCGYAGGLGPDNLQRQLEQINSQVFKTRGVWIDMETKVRSDMDFQFDLKKVRRCLEIAKPWVERAGHAEN